VLQKVRKKAESGARFFQTQAVCSRVELERLRQAVTPLGVPVLAGVLLVRSAKWPVSLTPTFPGCASRKR